MGCWSSKPLERQESMSRCKARRRYMKQLVKARTSFSFTHSLYLHSLRSTGSALLEFANAEAQSGPGPAQIPSRQPPPTPVAPPTPPPPPPPLSPCPSNWTTSSPILPPPPPLSWDFWDPFAASPSRSVASEWEEVSTQVSEAPTPPQEKNINSISVRASEDLAVVVAPRTHKDLAEVVKDLDEYFLKAADAGSRVSVLLEAPIGLHSSSNQGMMSMNDLFQ